MKSMVLQAAALATVALLAVVLVLWFTGGSGRMPILPTADAKPLQLPQPGSPLDLRWEPAAKATLYEVEIIEASTGLSALSGQTSTNRWSPPVEASDLLDRDREWLWRATAVIGK